MHWVGQVIAWANTFCFRAVNAVRHRRVHILYCCHWCHCVSHFVFVHANARLTHLYIKQCEYLPVIFSVYCAPVSFAGAVYFTPELNTDVWRRRNNVDELHAVENWLRRKIYINATAEPDIHRPTLESQYIDAAVVVSMLITFLSLM